MKKALCASLRQAILSRGFLAGTVGTALVLLLSSVQGILSAFRSAELLSPGFHSDLIMGALSSAHGSLPQGGRKRAELLWQPC